MLGGCEIVSPPSITGNLAQEGTGDVELPKQSRGQSPPIMPASYGTYGSPAASSSPPAHHRFRDHSPQKSSPLRHTVSTRSAASDATADSSIPSRHGTISSNASSGYGGTAGSGYTSGYESSDPFVNAGPPPTAGRIKRERSESPVKRSAAFAKWEKREQDAEQVESKQPRGDFTPRASQKTGQMMDISPTKIREENWRATLGDSNTSWRETALRSDRTRTALRPVAGNVLNGEGPSDMAPTGQPSANRSTVSPSRKENEEMHRLVGARASEGLMPPPSRPGLHHGRSQSADPNKSQSPDVPRQMNSIVPSSKNSAATLSRSDSMRASTRPARPSGHVRFGSTEAATPHLDGEDLAKLQKSSTPQFRHLSKMASENGGNEDFSIHSPEEQVAGLFGRRKLQRSGSVKPNTTKTSNFSTQYATTRWMDTQRKHLQAYEYLCHIGEARDWLQGVLEPLELPPIVQLEEALRDGVTLAEVVVRLGSSLSDEQQRALGSRRIFRNPRLQFRHSDNIALFFRFLAQVELPELFRFELVDLYEKKNIPKTIYCIHALSWLLYRKDIVEFRIGNLVGQLQFEEHELEETQKGIDRSGVQMPNFGGMREALQVEEPEPEPSPERLIAEQTEMIVDFQSQVRGALMRLRLGAVMNDLWDAEDAILRLQAIARAGFAREIFDFRFAMDQSTRVFQAAAKAFLVRNRRKRQERAWINNAPAVIKAQSLWRGRQSRFETKTIKTRLHQNQRGIRELQAALRGALSRWKAGDLWHSTRAAANGVEGFQACSRGAIARMRVGAIMNELWDVEAAIVQLQSGIRGWKVRQTMQLQRSKTRKTVVDIIKLQAVARGLIQRRELRTTHGNFQKQQERVVELQSVARGLVSRLRHARLKGTMQGNVGVVVALQGLLRGHLARSRVINAQQQLRGQESIVRSLQSLSRAMLVRKAVGTQLAEMDQHEEKITALQAIARAHIERQRVYEHLVAMEDEEKGIIDLQAFSRAMLERCRIGNLLSQLEEHEETTIKLQAVCRGFVVRARFETKKKHFHENMQKVIKLQSFVRAKQQGESYKSLVSGKNPPLPVVRRHLHLLTDTSLEFEGELEAERLRRQVVESVRRNELVEGYVEGLDVKIALLVKNKITLDEVVKHQKHFGGSASQLLRNGNSIGHHSGGLDLKALNKSSRRKLAGYEELLFTLQTQPMYFSRLFQKLAGKPLVEKESKNCERLVLTLFGYAQKSREEYFLLKILSTSATQMVQSSRDLEEAQRLLAGSFSQRLVLSYARSPRDRAWLKSVFGGTVRDGICAQDRLDLESDPLQIYRAILNNDELSTGQPSSRPRDLPREVVIREPDVRPIYVEHLQDLRDLCDNFLVSLEEALARMPYGLRFMAAEQYRALCERYPREEPAQMASVAGGWIWKTYFLPALREPEMWSVVDRGLSPLHKRNLSQVITVLGQVAAGRLFGSENLYLQPLNNWISESLERWQECLSQMFELPTPEEWFDADQFSDLYSRTKPTVYLKLGDLFSIHALIAENVAAIAPSRDDPIKELLTDLGSPKTNENDLSGAVDGSEITLTLRSRYTVQEDPNAESRQLFTATKRLVLYIIKVQSGANLMEILLRPITHEDADRWIQVVQEELAQKDAEHRLGHPRRSRTSTFDPRGSLRGARTQSVYSEAPSTFSEAVSEDRRDLLDLQGMTYAEVKSSALENILALEQATVPAQFRVSRHNHYQEVLNAIACDIRQKHRRRLDRQREVESTRATLAQLDAKAGFLEDQLHSYNDYIEQCLHTLASKKGSKHKFTLPFTKQWTHERELQRSGRRPRFGSYKYSARQLADKGVLVAWPAYAHEHWNQVNVVVSSDEVGVFHLEASSGSLMIPGASANLLLDDLLQAQYDNKATVTVFEEVGGNKGGADKGARLAVNLLLHLVFKKFYQDE